MKICALAQPAGNQSETIRYCERAGLLPEAARTDTNYRVYYPGHIQCLVFNHHYGSLDMTLEEIRTLLQFKDAPEENCEQVNGLLDEHIEHPATRIKELRSLQEDLKALREQYTNDRIALECGILIRLDKAAKLFSGQDRVRDHLDHVPGVHQTVGSTGVANPKIKKLR